jgi:hypothetical protein
MNIRGASKGQSIHGKARRGTFNLSWILGGRPWGAIGLANGLLWPAATVVQPASPGIFGLARGWAGLMLAKKRNSRRRSDEMLDRLMSW